MLLIGIDPGKSGGVAWAYTQDGTAYAERMPATERDVYDLLSLVTAARHAREIFAVIERVHSMPKQGVTSAFTFGRGYGFLRGCLTALAIPFDEVTPQRWQKALGCLSKGDKNVTKQRAQQLFPGVRVTHSVADALLIAEYARRLYGTENTGGLTT